MKITYKIIAVLGLVMLGLGPVWAASSGGEMLVGKISPSDLQQKPYGEWYNKQSEDYQIDSMAVKAFSKLAGDIEVKVIMGTWCHDSQRETPRFYKILAAANIDLSRVTLVAVDMNFETPDHDATGLGITNTPTFIFYRNGQEINRIVETPIVSLEQDMVSILRGEDYRHSKMAQIDQAK